MSSERVIFTMSGKGGVGKTGVMVALAEWFTANGITAKLLDLDTENKARGSLKHFFNGSVTKVNIHTPAGLDAFVDHLDSGAEIILADMGAGAGQIAADWFEAMHEDVAALGVSFTALGVVTPDPASVESVLAWASRLQDRVEYVIVENATSPQSDFTYWTATEQAKKFREAFSPTILQMEFRLAELENPVRQHGIRLGDVAERKAKVEELKRASLVMRAQSYRRRLFAQFDQVKEAFLP
ncbi:MinD-like ATPase involved in chromosome partitioning or flagellar assembly [Bryocella elongata]|uniref:MinD-like ATPase involved in chromosome partitioning or flagellar assembly n=1 Tax=Bryocella elongata TaxID=863522 RepID=A0A1H6BRT0_9BACT|nr:P-loop NTPase [Bryocella elongata]SEG63342.1 MinD-like ATPase involved in chromosome partitioning or flagellar assembly [Bryocella elongata]